MFEEGVNMEIPEPINTKLDEDIIRYKNMYQGTGAKDREGKIHLNEYSKGFCNQCMRYRVFQKYIDYDGLTLWRCTSSVEHPISKIRKTRSDKGLRHLTRAERELIQRMMSEEYKKD